LTYCGKILTYSPCPSPAWGNSRGGVVMNKIQNTRRELGKKILKISVIIFFSSICSCMAEEPVIEEPVIEEPVIEEPIINYEILTVGTFGGSLSRLQSYSARKIWNDNLRQENIDLKITSCGVGGMGFSSNTEKNVPWQIQNNDVFDIYILWCSTNDMIYGTIREIDTIDLTTDMVYRTIGEIGTTDLTTQSGGLLKSIELIKDLNDKAIIILFTSLPFFSNVNGYLSTGKLAEYVDAQKRFCEAYNIPYLDQFLLCGFTIDNCSEYYISDNLHLLENGYNYIAPIQANFIRKILKNAR